MAWLMRRNPDTLGHAPTRHIHVHPVEPFRPVYRTREQARARLAECAGYAAIARMEAGGVDEPQEEPAHFA